MKLFEKNVGAEDKIIRALLGIMAVYAFLNNWLAAPWSYLFIAAALALFATAALGWCHLYTMLGISTCPKNGNCPKAKV